MIAATQAGPRARAGDDTARLSLRSLLGAVFREPTTTLLGCAGFLARGGIVVVALEVWAIPSPAGISLLIPPTFISASGVSPQFAELLVAIGAGLAALAVAAGVVSAIVEIESLRFAMGVAARVAPAPSSRARASLREDVALTAPRMASGAPEPRRRRVSAGLVARLLLLEFAVLLPALAAAAIAARRLLEVGREQYIVPSSLAVPFVVRVVERALPEVGLLVACVLLADLIYALGSRWLLRRSLQRPVPDVPSADVPAGDAATAPDRLGAPGARGAGGWALFPARLVLAWVAGWAVTLVVVGGGLIGVAVVRDRLVRIVLGLSAGADLASVLLFVGTVAALVAVWGLALLLAGAASAFRAACWDWLLVLEPRSYPSATLRRPVATPRED